MNRIAFATVLIAGFMLCADCLGKSAVPQRAEGVPAQERQALIALYEATDGVHWKNHEGWMGPTGTECNWYGVLCDNFSQKITTVMSLDLPENDLNGRIPDVIGQLAHLQQLFLFHNKLTGRLPDSMIRRWLAGSLWVNVEALQLTGVSEIDYEWSSSSLLCTQHRVLLHADGNAERFTELCRNATPDDRTTFCAVEKGRVMWEDFGRLAWLIEKNGFFALKHDYDRSITEGVFESTRVTRNRKQYEVISYADAGPNELWAILRAAQGVSSSIEWESSETLPKCPRWDKPKTDSSN
jgi:hypothetical protein